MWWKVALIVMLITVGGVLSVGIFSTDTKSPVGIVVPHHDLVAPVRQAYLAEISATYQPETIILVSPDHFNQNNTPITTTGTDWQTSLGELLVSTDLLQSLGLPESDTSFTYEHGITTLLKDIKQYFPNSKILPVMLGRKATYSEVSEFIANLYKKCPDCFFVASVDFSHTNATVLADIHDKLALRELQQADAVTLYKHAEVDSPETLAALALWGNIHSQQSFRLFSHTNSGYIASKTVGEITSHIIGGYYAYPDDTSPPVEEVTVMIGGDTMFARGVEEQWMSEPESSLLTKLGERFFWGVDIALLNLEGVFSDDETRLVGWNELPPRLRFDPKIATILKQNRISAVGLANNHTFDGGVAEADFTKNIFADLNIATVGYPRGTSSVILKEEGGTKVAIIAIATHEPVTDIAELVMYYSELGYRTLVYIHWGQEYTKTPTVAQEQMAKRLVDAGADLVVGSHPHVFQTVAVYNGVPIIYSLGNFLFDQAFAVDTQVGAILGATVSQSGIELFLLPIKSYMATEIIGEPEYTNLIQRWTEPWSNYATPNNQFYFPTTK